MMITNALGQVKGLLGNLDLFNTTKNTKVMKTHLRRIDKGESFTEEYKQK